MTPRMHWMRCDAVGDAVDGASGEFPLNHKITSAYRFVFFEYLTPRSYRKDFSIPLSCAGDAEDWLVLE